MDSFMDKLAQKLTAQEMIKANTAADAEEMKRLKSQVKEYREILTQLQKLVDDSAAKLENAKVDGTEINRLVESGIAKINEIQCQAQDNGNLQETLGQIEMSLNLKMNSLSESMTRMEQAVGEKLESAGETLGQAVQPLDAKFESVNDSMHKEGVKIYRNVQAVVLEENSKQTESILAVVKAMKGKLGAVLGISIVALLAAIGGVVFQVLVYLQII